MERIEDLLLERASPRGPAKPVPLLFVHGMWGGSWYWDHYLRGAAEAGWEAWALNLRGHHGSRPVANLGTVSVAEYVQDVLDCLRVLGEVVLVGHSMGGLIAQKVAEVGGVRAAVFLTSAAPRGILVLRWPVLSRMGRYLPSMLRNAAFLATRADADALVLNRLPPAQQAEVYSRLVPESGRAARELAFGLIGVNERQVGCPTLVVGAEWDQITPAAVERRIAAKYAADYLEMARHGHMLMLEEGWERPFKEILGWVEKALAGEGRV
ncbi:MAG: alpha/beta hydrolase [Candidatus Rokubacteria bacterium]|nr:alpha/beta hydrolase [Candidatus Rokubacteria bacterium]